MVEQGIKIVKFSQASTLAKIISNKTAQQIIEHIGSSKKLTASQIAKSLDLPASTVHYNMKALVKGGIVDDSQYTYSSKGKTIIHYTLTNNILVIIPETKNNFSVMDSIKSIKSLMPSLIGVGLVGLGYSLFLKTKTNTVNSLSKTTRGIDTAIMDFATAPLAEEGESAILTRSTELITQTSSSNHDFLWGLTIAVLIITFIFLIRNYLLSRQK